MHDNFTMELYREMMDKLYISTVKNIDTDTFWWTSANFTKRFKHEEAKVGDIFFDGNNGDRHIVLAVNHDNKRLLIRNTSQCPEPTLCMYGFPFDREISLNDVERAIEKRLLSDNDIALILASISKRMVMAEIAKKSATPALDSIDITLPDEVQTNTRCEGCLYDNKLLADDDCRHCHQDEEDED